MDGTTQKTTLGYAVAKSIQIIILHFQRIKFYLNHAIACYLLIKY